MCHNMKINLLSSTEVISTCLLYPTTGSHPSTCSAFSSSLPSLLPVVSCEFSSVFVGWGHCLVTIIITLFPRLLCMNRGHQHNCCVQQNTGFTFCTGPNLEKMLQPLIHAVYKENILCVRLSLFVCVCFFSALLSWTSDILVGIWHLTFIASNSFKYSRAA